MYCELWVLLHICIFPLFENLTCQMEWKYFLSSFPLSYVLFLSFANTAHLIYKRKSFLHLIHLKCQKTTIQMRWFLINLFTKINSFFCVFEVMMKKIVKIMNEEFCKFSVEKIFLRKHKTVNVYFSITFISVCTEIHCNLAIYSFRPKKTGIK